MIYHHHHHNGHPLRRMRATSAFGFQVLVEELLLLSQYELTLTEWIAHHLFLTQTLRGKRRRQRSLETEFVAYPCGKCKQIKADNGWKRRTKKRRRGGGVGVGVMGALCCAKQRED